MFYNGTGKNEKMQEYRKNWNGKWENAQTEQ